MADRGKVIKALECCLKESDHLYSNPCNGCPYAGKECIDRMKADALELLKEQQSNIKYWSAKYDEMGKQYMAVRDERDELLKEKEPVEPMATITANGIHHDFCGKCGRLLPMGQAKFCSYCGQAVKWE